MKIIKKILIAVVVLAAIILTIGFLSPRKVYLERTITINATSASVFEEINGYKNFNKWSPWAKIDPKNTEYTYSGAETGVGAKMSWTSDNSDVGIGSQEIVESILNEKTRNEMYFGGYPDPNFADLVLVSDGNSCTVTWTFDGDMGSGPIGRLFGHFMESILGPTYEEGLQNLKNHVESKPKYSIRIGIENKEAITYLAINNTFDLTKPETIGLKFGELYGKIGAYMAVNQIESIGMPMFVTQETSETEWAGDVAISCASDMAIPSDDVIVGTTTGGKTIKGIHLGSYDKLEESHAQMMQYMKFNNLESSGNIFEVYQTDPMNELDTAKWQTHLFYPIK